MNFKWVIIRLIRFLKIYPLARILWLTYDRYHIIRRIKEKRFFSQFIQKDDLCFDIGACFGSRTKTFLALKAKVICVEPQAICLKELRKSFSRNKNVTILPIGVSNKKGFTTLHICNNEPAIATISSTYEEKGRFSKDFKYESTQKIPINTLNNLIKKYGMPKFCKIDVEGAEKQVLQGLTKTIPFISFEFHKEFINAAKKSITHLKSLGRVDFNCSLGDSMKFLFPTWVNDKKLFKKLESLKDKYLQGDIYVRFNNGKYTPLNSLYKQRIIPEPYEGERYKSHYNSKYFKDRDYLDLHLAESLKIFMKENDLKKVLDVGCGTGKLVKFLNDNGFQAYGCDNAKIAIKTAQSINKKNVIKKASATKLPFKTNSFNLVVSISTIEHLTKKEVSSFLKEAYRLLKSRGFIFIITPNYASPMRFILGKKWFGYSDPTHITFFTPKTLSALLSQNRFNSIRLRLNTAFDVRSDLHLPGFLRKFPLPIKNFFNYIMVSSPLSTFRDSFWIAARKK